MGNGSIFESNHPGTRGSTRFISKREEGKATNQTFSYGRGTGKKKNS